MDLKWWIEHKLPDGTPMIVPPILAMVGFVIGVLFWMSIL